MARYRYRQHVLVDAMQWRGDLEEAEKFSGRKLKISENRLMLSPICQLTPGDWVVKNNDGSLSRVSPEDFERRFEMVTDVGL